MGKQNSVAANIDHRYYMMKEKDRYYALKRILDYYPDIFGLIFCRTRRETSLTCDKLEKEGYDRVKLKKSKKEDLIALEGIGEKTAEKILAAV